jgi:hypothetical protein
VGLIEVALAILVGIVVVSAAAIGVQRSRDRAHTAELSGEQDLVFAAADAYYRARCLSGTLPSSVTLPALLAQGYMPRAARDIWGASWSVTYLSGPPRALVSATLVSASGAQMAWISAYASADTVAGNTVTWVHNIRMVHDTATASTLEFQAMYEVSTC